MVIIPIADKAIITERMAVAIIISTRLKPLILLLLPR